MNKELAINLLRGSVLGTNEQLHEAVFMAIKALKTEPKHGQWNNIKISVSDNSSAECSLCGAIVHNNFSNVINYCPNCGADMRPQEEVHYIPVPEWLKGVGEE